MDEAGATYDAQERFYLRVIRKCESEKARLRSQLLLLYVQSAVAELLNPEVAADLAALIESVKDRIRELDDLEEQARAALRQLRRDHGPVRWARADSPEGGAEKSHYAGAGQ